MSRIDCVSGYEETLRELASFPRDELTVESRECSSDLYRGVEYTIIGPANVRPILEWAADMPELMIEHVSTLPTEDGDIDARQPVLKVFLVPTPETTLGGAFTERTT